MSAHLTPLYHTYAAVLEVNCISPHQVLLECKINDFSHKEACDAIAAVAARFPHSDVTTDSDLKLTLLLNVSCFVGESTRNSYTEDCLYGGLSVCLFFSISCATGSTSPRYQMVFANFYLEIITPSTLCDV